ncbi:MAG: polyprenyl diphosphate synthase [Planctomycetota bacterium]
MIMDGNGRWAVNQGLPRIEGHRKGAETVRMVTECSAAWGLQAITLYCLSSENWKRPREEIDFLMSLLMEYLQEERDTLTKNNVRLRIIGRRDRLSPEIIRAMDETVAMSAENDGTQLVLAIDYGGRDEIVRSVRSILSRTLGQEGVAPSDIPNVLASISENSISDSLDTHDLPDPDLLIRTGGEMRISNYLLWQISYSELWVTEKSWPDFSREDYLYAVECFAARHRRYGGL